MEAKLRACIGRLERRRNKILVIMELIGEKRGLTGEDKDRAQALLKVLKGKLRADYRFGNTAKGRAQMTETELHFYHPAVHEALTRIRVKTNSVPDPQWVSQLYEALMNVDHYLHELRD